MDPSCSSIDLHVNVKFISMLNETVSQYTLCQTPPTFMRCRTSLKTHASIGLPQLSFDCS